MGTRLTRRHTLGVLGAAFALPRAARAENHYSLTPVEVSDKIWIIEGKREAYSHANGGAAVNSILIGTETGIIIVDTGPTQKYGIALRRLANELSAKGVAAVINTHHHAGHILGNQVFNELQILALPGTIQSAKSGGEQALARMSNLVGDWADGTSLVPPNTALPDGMIAFGERRFELIPLQGHCENDLALIDGATGTLICGDLVFHNHAPNTQSADFKAWLGALDVLEQTGHSGILPGHGPFDATNQSLNQTRRYLEWLETRLNSAVALGLDEETVAAIGQPDDIAALGAMPGEYERGVSANLPKFSQEQGVGQN